MPFEFCNNYFADQHVRNLLDEFACLYVREAQDKNDRSDGTFVETRHDAGGPHDGKRGADMIRTPVPPKPSAICSIPSCDACTAQEHPKLPVIIALRNFLQEHLQQQLAWRERHRYILVMALDRTSPQPAAGENATPTPWPSPTHRAARQFAEKLAGLVGAVVIEPRQRDAVIANLSDAPPIAHHATDHHRLPTTESPAVLTSAVRSDHAERTGQTPAQSIAALRSLITPEGSEVDEERIKRLNQSRLGAVHEMRRQISARAETGPAVLLCSEWPCAVADALMLADGMGEPRGVFAFRADLDASAPVNASSLHRCGASSSSGAAGESASAEHQVGDSACEESAQAVMARMKLEVGFTSKVEERVAFLQYYRSLGILREMRAVDSGEQNMVSPTTRAALAHAQSLLRTDAHE